MGQGRGTELRENSFCSEPKWRQRKTVKVKHLTLTVQFKYPSDPSLHTVSQSPYICVTRGMQNATIVRKSHLVNLKADNSGSDRHVALYSFYKWTI